MKKKFFLLILLIFHLFLLFAQTIHINSISFKRQPSGDNGYTLDGLRMTGARAKLLNQNNFGLYGIYHKSIILYDGYEISGSIIMNNVPLSNIFFFGTFDKNNPTTQQFTDAEIDSLYNWSVKGGKILICATPSLLPNNDMAILEDRWGFSLQNDYPTYIIPNSQGNLTEIFTGPFDTVYAAYQGGYLEGYFVTIPSNSIVLATNGENNPTMIIDCYTLDLIVADVDAFTDLGGVSAGQTVSSPNDKLWLNSIVFMDKLQNPPIILNNGNDMSCTETYNDYQWYLNGEEILGANEPLYTATQAGSYYLQATLNGGCKLLSNTIVIEIIPEETFTLEVPDVFTPNGDGVNDTIFVRGIGIKQLLEFSIFNRWGQVVFETNDINKGWDGTFYGKSQNVDSYAYTVKAISLDGRTLFKKGLINLIR